MTCAAVSAGCSCRGPVVPGPERCVTAVTNPHADPPRSPGYRITSTRMVAIWFPLRVWFPLLVWFPLPVWFPLR